MKKVLLVGGFGFIGSNIMKYIDNYLPGKYQVIVVDKTSEHPFDIQFNCIDCVYSGDFTEEGFLRTIFSEYKFDYVIHSLSTTVPINSNNSRYDIESNLIPTIELLNLMVEFTVKNIIYISSGGAIYGLQNHSYKHKESDDAFPMSSYGVVKLATEKYLFQYAYLYGLKPLVLRVSNPYGKYHYSKIQGVINVALDAASNDEIFFVWGNGEARKDYIYIDDFCNIMFDLMEKNISNKILNIASGELLSLNQILFSIGERYPSFRWEYTVPNKYDISYFELDTKELLKLVGEYDFTSFQEGFLRLVDWKTKKSDE
jgi:UDP-glucose 4-epimerase